MRRTSYAVALLSVISLAPPTNPATAQTPEENARSLIEQIRLELALEEAKVLEAEQAPPMPGSTREALARLSELQQSIAQAEAKEAQARAVTKATLDKIVTVVAQVAVSAPQPVPSVPVQNCALGGQDPSCGDATVPPAPVVTGTTAEPSLTVAMPGPVVTDEAPEAELFGIDRTTPIETGGLPQRVLVLPNAEMVKNPSDPKTRRAPLPVFSILYVFGEQTYQGERWLAVGETQDHQDGWIQDYKTETWRSMLVMRYARKSNRDRVLFFSEPDPIHEIIEDSFFGRREVDDIYSRITDGTYDPNQIIAIEPGGVVDDSENVYLMPILGFEPGEFDDGTPTQILQLAGLNLNSENRTEGLPSVPLSQDDVDDTSALEELRVGLAFVIDTTTSMGPYISEAQDFVAQIETGLNDVGVADRFDIALVGYRDSLEPNSAIEYHTEIFRDFGDTESKAAASDAKRLEPSRVSTKDWREDAFAGLTDAINRLNWNKVDGRIVFLVTDASPRTVGDSLARDPAMGPATIAQMAEASDVTLFVMHMVSEHAKQVSLVTDGVDDTAVGRRVYQQLKALGGDRVGYFLLFGDSAESFGVGLRQTANTIIPTLVDAAKGKAITQDSLISGSTQASGQLDPDVALYSLSADNVEIRDGDEAGAIASAVLSELFRQQQEFLGARNAVEAPEFYRAWAADRDLSRPSLQSLDVSVMLSRGQLSDLTTRLEDLLEAMQNKEKGMGDFFAEIQDRSGRTLLDPNISDILPKYLSELPYVSKLLALTAEEWDRYPPQTQKEFVDDVRAKVRGYREVAESQRNWYRLSDREGSEDLYPLPLALLP